ncbi:hypothetical protein RRG08_029454 [Elysia crispata]|uniref:Uncharacterized protein n=1 Tax=Elysia crispata TaxID=231223 RepID=A0AAE1BEX4_9GAST|nr:hypothetical protein RRG08_029454 [Elysia crispata]
MLEPIKVSGAAVSVCPQHDYMRTECEYTWTRPISNSDDAHGMPVLIGRVNGKKSIVLQGIERSETTRIVKI